MPGAFSRAVSEDDVRALFNHDPSNLLGRSSAGTLKLRADKNRSPGAGLHYQITVGNTQVAKDVLEHIERGDLQGSSFSFETTDETWRKDDGVNVREIRGVRLFDVGPVTFPAYEATTVDAKSVGDFKSAEASFRAWDDSERRKSKARSVLVGLTMPGK